jgi:hypothetical protein
MWKGSLCLVASFDFNRMFFLAFLSNNNEMHRGNIMAYKSKAYWLPMPCIALYCFETAKLFKPIGVPISCHPIYNWFSHGLHQGSQNSVPRGEASAHPT